MNARKMKLRPMDDCLKSKSFTVFAFVLLSWTSGSTAIAAHPTSRRNPPATENPIYRVAKQPLDCTGRFLGTGWGDGYHSRHGSGFRPGADLPPKSSHATRRRITRYGNTYYDRFDNHNLIHQGHYQASARAPSRSCDQNGDCDQVGAWNQEFAIEKFDRDSVPAMVEQPFIDPPIISESPSRDRNSLAHKFESKSIDLASEIQSPIALSAVPIALLPVADQSSGSGSPAASGTGADRLVQMVGQPDPPTEPQLPPARDSSATASSKPSRMPSTDAKPRRVAQFVPRPDSLDPAINSLPQQSTARVAEVPQWALDAAGTVQQNQFVR